MRKRVYDIAVALTMVLHADFAASHAVLVSSAPAAGALLTETPREIRLSFNEQIESRFSRVIVRRRGGNTVEVGPVSGSQKRTDLIVPVPPLQPGKYQVHWETTSSDSHRMQGDFEFEIRP
jgi:methionine-rich copper-binding protein CopC